MSHGLRGSITGHGLRGSLTGHGLRGSITGHGLRGSLTGHGLRGWGQILFAGFAVLVVLLWYEASASSRIQPLQLTGRKMVDLTHEFGPRTLYWPTSPTKFQHEKLAYGPTPGGWFYSAYSLCTPEHGGTHLDAPVHFGEGKWAADQIPLERLIAPAVVIDVTAAAAKDRDYRLTAVDVEQFEKRNGRIAAGTIVLMRTGWNRHWPDAKAYLGDDTPGDASKLSFPGFGEEAGRLLVEGRQVAALGIDTASIDYGRSQDYVVHRIGSARNVFNLENLTNLDKLPPKGATVIALPMKIQEGSGGPLRAVAIF
jgi:kynurenine formamidase